MLGGHPAVDQVAVVGAPDPVLGEIGVAFVVPRPEPIAATSRRCWPTCAAAARAALADYKAPDRLVVVDSLPADLDDEGRQAGPGRPGRRRARRSGRVRGSRTDPGRPTTTDERSPSIMTGTIHARHRAG